MSSMTVPYLDLAAQYESIKPEIDDAIQSVIRDTAFVRGRYVTEFEKSFASLHGVAHCVGVANGTDALAVALRGLGVGPGDEVITAANSWIASAEAATMVGARPVFVDIEEQALLRGPSFGRGRSHGPDQGHHAGSFVRSPRRRACPAGDR